jgi:hypothetical protein
LYVSRKDAELSQVYGKQIKQQQNILRFKTQLKSNPHIRITSRHIRVHQYLTARNDDRNNIQSATHLIILADGHAAHVVLLAQLLAERGAHQLVALAVITEEERTFMVQ